MSALLADAAQLGPWLGLGELEDDMLDRAELVVRIVSDAARGEAKQPDWDLENCPSEVAAIVLMAAASSFVNPDGKTSVTTEEVTRRWSAGELFSASQVAKLRSYRPSASGGIGTIQYGPAYYQSPRWTPVVGGEPIRLYDGDGYGS